MTRAEASRKARDLWQGGFAVRMSEPRRHLRFVVGVRMGSLVPLGAGDSFEAAFAAAEARGFTAEKVAAKWVEYVDATADLKQRMRELAE